MKAKKLAISIFAIIFILFTLVSFLVYDNSSSLNIVTESGSYAETYAKEHNINCKIISDTEKDMVQSLEEFEYNNDGTITAYKGNSETIVIPKKIGDVTIKNIAENAFENAKNLKAIYLSDGIKLEADTVKGLTVYTPSSAEIAEELKAEGVTILEYADSENLNFYSADIPFEYSTDNNKITVDKYTGIGDATVPAYISGNPVITLNIDALADGISTIFIPSTVTEIEKDLYTARYDVTFAVGILIALAGLAVAIFGTIKANLSSKEKTFLGVSFLTEAYGISILSAVLGIVYYFLLPIIGLGIVFTAFIVAFGLFTFLKVQVAIDEVEKVDAKVKTQTQFIKMTTVNAEKIVNYAKSDAVKSECKKVYEALRYSDPMSSDSLKIAEAKITAKMNDLANVVATDNAENAKAVADEILLLVKERNSLCKTLK